VVNTAGGVLTGATVPAAKLFGDVRNGSGAIADQTNVTTFAPLFITAPVLPQGGGLEDSIAVFSPATNPGTVPTATPSLAINFYTSGGVLTSTTVSNSCVYTNTLTGIFGGTAAGGGRVEVTASGDKGVVGWRFFKFTSGGIGLLLAELMQSWGTFSFEASTQ
jgi:hypothetical protein